MTGSSYSFRSISYSSSQLSLILKQHDESTGFPLIMAFLFILELYFLFCEASHSNFHITARCYLQADCFGMNFILKKYPFLSKINKNIIYYQLVSFFCYLKA